MGHVARMGYIRNTCTSRKHEKTTCKTQVKIEGNIEMYHKESVMVWTGLGVQGRVLLNTVMSHMIPKIGRNFLSSCPTISFL
jgi:hypothetical protein